LAVVLVLVTPGAVLDRAASSGNLGRAEISHRFDYWQGALLVAETRPVFGVGVSNFKYAFAKLPVSETAQRIAIHAHNIVLALLSETGIVGLVAFGSFIAGTLVLLLRRRRADTCEDRRLWRLAIAAAIIGSMAHQMTDVFLLEPTVNVILWTFAAIAVLLGDGLIDDGERPSVLAGSSK
jgi:O-antigen ligase